MARALVLTTIVALSACGGTPEPVCCDGGPDGSGPTGTDAGVADAGIGDDDAGTVPGADSGTDAGSDGRSDAGPPPPPAMPSRFSFGARSVDPLDATRLGDGVVVVGELRMGTEVDAVALHYGPDGESRWAARLGQTGRNERLYAVARREGSGGPEVVSVGLVRGERGGSRNDDVLVTQVTGTGLEGARAFGTTGDELLFGVADGGSVAAWIGVGRCGSGPNRRGLVVAFSASLDVVWARCVTVTDHDAYFTDVAVVGDAVFAVGTAEAPERRLVITRIATAGGMPSAVSGWRSTVAGSGALAVRPGPDESEVEVLGRLDERPVRLRIGSSGELLEATRLETFGALSNVWRRGSAVAFVGVYSPAGPFIPTPFLATLDAADPNVVRFVSGENPAVSGFVRTPLVDLDTSTRLVARRDGAAIDLPFNSALETSCAADAEAVAWTAIDAPLVTVTTSLADLSLAGPNDVTPVASAEPTQASGCGP